METEEKFFANGVTEDNVVSAWVNVRRMLNMAYGEKFVTANPVLIAAGIVAEAIYCQGDTMDAIEDNLFDGFKALSDEVHGNTTAIYDTRDD